MTDAGYMPKLFKSTTSAICKAVQSGWLSSGSPILDIALGLRSSSFFIRYNLHGIGLTIIAYQSKTIRIREFADNDLPPPSSL